MDSINIVFIGGTLRAKNTLLKFLTLSFIKIEYAIFMKGYDDEIIYADQMPVLQKIMALNT